jgi:hypothetical protein
MTDTFNCIPMRPRHAPGNPFCGSRNLYCASADPFCSLAYLFCGPDFPFCGPENTGCAADFLCAWHDTDRCGQAYPFWKHDFPLWGPDFPFCGLPFLRNRLHFNQLPTFDPRSAFYKPFLLFTGISTVSLAVTVKNP